MRTRRASAAFRASKIVTAGLVAGTLDISDSLIFNALRGISPKTVLQFIASGLLGLHAFDLGWRAAAAGLLFHYAIAMIWTAAFFLTARKFAIVRRSAVWSGLIYGVFVYLVMNIIVVPLSRAPAIRSVSLAGRINGVLAVMVFIGLIISVLLKKSYSEPPIRDEGTRKPFKYSFRIS